MKLLKNPLVFFGTLVTSVLLTATVAFAAPVEVDGYKMLLNGEQFALDGDTPALIDEGRTLLPLRAFFGIVNKDGTGTIGWDEGTKQVSLTYGDTDVKMWIGNTAASVNGADASIDGTYPIIYNDLTYVPLRFLSNVFNMSIHWDENTNTTIVMDNTLLDKIVAICNGVDQQTENSKVYMEFASVISGEVSMDGYSESMDSSTKGIIKQDMANSFYHVYMEVDALDENIVTEVYDDGKHSYVVVGDEIVKMESTFDYADDIMSQYNIVSNMDLERQLYSSLKLDEKDGNYVISGNMYLPKSYFSDLMQSLEGMEELSSMLAAMNITMPKPMQYSIIINKETGRLVSMTVIYDMLMEMDLDGLMIRVDMSCDMEIPKMIFDADFESIVPLEITDNVSEL